MCGCPRLGVDGAGKSADRLVLVGVDADRPQMMARFRQVGGGLEHAEARRAGGGEDHVGARLVHRRRGALPGAGCQEAAGVVGWAGEVRAEDAHVGIDSAGAGLEPCLELPDRVDVDTADESDRAGRRGQRGGGTDEVRALVDGERDRADVGRASPAGRAR